MQRFDQVLPEITSITQQCYLVSMLWVLIVRRVVGGQWWTVYARMVESTVALIPAASLHHEVTTHRPLGHV